MRKTKDPLRTEAAVRKAIKDWVNIHGHTAAMLERSTGEIYFVCINTGVITARADLRDLHRKRAPIKMKDLRKAIQPRRKR